MGAAGSTDLVFQAPPAPVGGELDEAPALPNGSGRQGAGRRSGGSTGSGGKGPAGGSSSDLRMLKGARQAASGMKISDAQIRAVLEDPQDVQPDPNQPQRTRLRRDGVVVTTGQDGMILRVSRRR